MRNTCSLVINGQHVKANVGETLVDAGLGGWILVPHDCCSGQCETCRVRVIGGAIDDQGTADGNTVLGCQATVEGDAEIEFEHVPALSKRAGILTEVTPLSPEVVEIAVALDAPIEYRPGQYVSVKFSGFPARDLSPTLRLDGTRAADELVFQMKRFPGGIVSTQLGATIRPGHRVQVRGPFGHSFLREGTGPLILVAGGTGFAPIWSIAREARLTQRNRDMMVIAGVRSVANLYMRDALAMLADDGILEVVATCSREIHPSVRRGRPTHYLPSLGPEDTVYVSGAPGLVDAVKEKTRAGTARCYADPFLPSARKLSLVDRIMRMMQKSGDASTAAPPLLASPRTSRMSVIPASGRGGRSGPGAAEAQPATSVAPSRRQTRG
jgi:3-phenylpropionate/trans-cinnamate dioxygenase ferredoxin reductase subunit